MSGGGLSKVGNGFGQGTGALLAKNATSGFSYGSKVCPILSECRDLGKGIAHGDFGKAALNAGILGVYAASVVPSSTSQVKVGVNSLYKRNLTIGASKMHFTVQTVQGGNAANDIRDNETTQEKGNAGKTIASEGQDEVLETCD